MKHTLFDFFRNMKKLFPLSTTGMIFLPVTLAGVGLVGVFGDQSGQRDGTHTILVDSGEGAAERLARAGVPLQSVHTVMLSHLRIEETGGLFAILGMRIQGFLSGDLTIYGPHGTQRIVDGLIAALKPLTDLRRSTGADTPLASHTANVSVIEVTDGSQFMIGSVTVTVAANRQTNRTDAARSQPLSYRFDTPERSLVYPDGTGTNVERLTHHINLLSCESSNPPTPLLKQDADASAVSNAVKQDHPMRFTTLGTQSGPLAIAQRSQPAHLLRKGAHTLLIDVGDGAVEQLAKVGVPLQSVHTILISHLHIDHTGDLYALLGMHLQKPLSGELTIYGPYGTQQMVDGLVAALQPLVDFSETPPTVNVNVIEVTDGSQFTIGPLAVTAATNTHYSFEAGGANAARFQSLSYRFDTPERSLVYTGDTGPSTNVERLAHHADLLISEICDPDAVIARIEQTPTMPSFFKRLMKKHFEQEHLTANEVGLLAQRSGAKALALIHIGIRDARSIERARHTISLHFKGSITFANDLETF
jgi:ribonuclease BN (tRNA processing enzyme)